MSSKKAAGWLRLANPAQSGQVTAAVLNLSVQVGGRLKMTNYTLMHKNIEVADIEIDESAIAITGIGTVHNADHIPLGVQSMKGGIDRDEMND